ncbi:MAG: aminotransferase class V-fold PLP-dependent enzyme [Bacteroidales bacterium]|nr:aminotransferase class V-fold PLP-dependent enzyme [Bacteroidales bacterium]
MKYRIIAATAIIAGTLAACTVNNGKSSGYEELDRWAEEMVQKHLNQLGYPVNQNSHLEGFYEWYIANGLDRTVMNNAGNPFDSTSSLLSSHKFEREVLKFFAPLYGFEKDKFWGMVSSSGTDGNNHGIYFGANYLYNTTGKKPVMYVSDEAHYSNMRLADLQNLDLKLIKSDDMGRMIPEELEKDLDPSRPCLIVYAMGSTFKGAIDDQKALNAVLAKHPEMPVYRHVDAALFGGYLPFTEYAGMVDHNELNFQSIAISGHKFFGVDDPAGLFFTTKEVFDNQSKYDIPYLNRDMKMISCSRSAITPLKFWWLIQKAGYETWKQEAGQMLENTAYLKAEMDRIGWPCWVNEYSNTIFFRRPSKDTVKKYYLACNNDDRFGGELAHIVVMQHVTKECIDELIAVLEKEL